MIEADYIEEFRAAMAKAGIVIAGQITPNAGIQRCYVEGDKLGSENGWYSLHIDEHPAGAFGSWKGEKHIWHSKHGQPMTPEQRQEWEKQIVEFQRERERDQERLALDAAKRAQTILDKSWPAPADHPYLRAKQIEPHGVRLHNGALVVPMRDTDGKIYSLHFISADGRKKFLHDGAIKGHFYSFWDIQPRGRLWVGEGFATMASVHELTREPVMAACNAGNLLAVAVALHDRYPGAELVIAADNDRLIRGNPGLTKALEAARAVRSQVSVPWFADISTHPTDWNDARRLHGDVLTKRSLIRNVMTPDRYIERTRQKDHEWADHARETGWSRQVVERGLAQRQIERGFSRAR